MQRFLFWGLYITEITSKIVYIYNIFLGRMTIPLVKFSGILEANKVKILNSKRAKRILKVCAEEKG